MWVGGVTMYNQLVSGGENTCVTGDLRRMDLHKNMPLIAKHYKMGTHDDDTFVVGIVIVPGTKLKLCRLGLTRIRSSCP